MNRKQLEDLCDRVDAVLAQHSIPGKVVGGDAQAHTLEFRARLEERENLQQALEKALTLGPAFAQALKAPTCTVSLGTHFDPTHGFSRVVRIKIPIERGPQFLDVLQIVSDLQPLPELTAALGREPNGRGLFARLTAPEAHHVLATGDGALNLVRAMALSLAHAHPGQAAYLVVGDSLEDLSVLDGFIPSHLAPALVRELGRVVVRYVTEGYRAPATILFLDDLESLPEDALRDLLRHGHHVGVHVIAASREENGSSLTFPLLLVPHGANYVAHVRLTGERIPFLPATVAMQQAIEALPGIQIATLSALAVLDGK
jgi:hypothetical protein